MSQQVIYLIGSLRNPEIPHIANRLREEGFEVVDDWFSAGPEADDYWQAHEAIRGRHYREALNGLHARDVFEFDKRHLDRADIGVLVMPAGKSAHIELGYICKDKRGFVLFNDVPERFDVMYQFAEDVCFSVEELVEAVKKPAPPRPPKTYTLYLPFGFRLEVRW